MNQTEKNLFWRNYQEWCWTLLQFSILLSCFLFLFGLALWIQSVILAIMILSFFVFLFSSQVKNVFKGTALKGYDPWHLKSLRDQYLSKVELIVHSHPTPFISGYDFYRNKKLILSSSFLNHSKKDEIAIQLQGIALLFNNGFFQSFTWVSYLFFLIFLPFQPLLILFKRFPSVRRIIESFPSFLCFCISFPFRYWIHQQYYLIDQKLSLLFKTKKQYSEWIWKMHTFWGVSSERPPMFLNSLFLTNPLTHCAFYFNIHPCIERRIEKLTGSFPV